MTEWEAISRLHKILHIPPVELSDEAKTKIVAAVDFCYYQTSHYDASHDINHHLDTTENMMYRIKIRVMMGEKLTERDIVRRIVKMLVHDIIDYKYCLPYLPTAEVTVEQQKELVRKFLTGLLPDDVKNILDDIDNMSWSKTRGELTPPNPELQDCRECDWIEAVRNGIQRMRDYRQTCMPDATESEIISEMLKHCDEKLFKVPAGCYSAWAKTQAAAYVERDIRPWYIANKKKK